MASVSPSPFTLREFLQIVLPAIIGLCLFAPLIFPLGAITVERIIFAGIIFGYLISSLITQIARILRKIIPGFRKRERSFEWVAANWDLYRLQDAYLTKDDLETLDVVNSNAIFAEMLGIYLTAYLGYNVFHLVKEIVSKTEAWWPLGSADKWNGLRLAFSHVNTQMVFGSLIPTWIIILVTSVLVALSVKDFLKGYGALFSIGGMYDQLANRYHLAGNSIAKRVWGRVLVNGKPKDGVTVRLSKPDESEPQDTLTDREGYFKFDRKIEKCEEFKIELVEDKTRSVPPVTKNLCQTTPEVLFDIPLSAVESQLAAVTNVSNQPTITYYRYSERSLRPRKKYRYRIVRRSIK